MKRCFMYLLTALMLISLWGCRQAPATVPSTAGQETTETTEPAPTETHPKITAEQQPMAVISMPVVTENETAADGTVIFSHTYQNITLTLPEPEVAEKITLDFLNRTDLHDIALSIRDAAIAAHTQGSGITDPYLCSSVYAPVRIDRGVLSLLGNDVTYEGGAHGSQVSKSVSYDMVTGNALTWQDILQDGITSGDICTLVLDALGEHKDKSQLFPDYPQTVESIFAQGLQHHTDWYFSNDGLHCFFSPYEIAPFATGTVTAKISYAALTGILKDEYFPPERDVANGLLTVERFNEEKQENFSQFAEVVLKDGSEKFLIYTDSIVYDVRLETGKLSADGKKFIPTHTVLGAAALTPGDAIMIETPVDDLNTKLQITYSSGEETVTLIPDIA